MVTRHCNKKVGNRFAEEMQLIAEEKWILETLSKIKKQRNSLQIERLQLESLKAELNSNVRKEVEIQKQTPVVEVPVTSTIDLMQTSKVDLNPRIPSDTGAVTDLSEFHGFDVQCNTEELNLHVTTPMFDRPQSIVNGIEEDESEDDEDNVFIDINMLMNGIRDENME